MENKNEVENTNNNNNDINKSDANPIENINNPIHLNIDVKNSDSKIPIYDSFLNNNNNNNHTSEQIRIEGKNIIRNFLKEYKCYELIKNSGKVLVFDINIPINLAFFALIEHDIKFATLWDNDIDSYVDVLSCSDLLSIITYYYNRNLPLTELNQHSIKTWKAISSTFDFPINKDIISNNEFITISPENSLFDALLILNNKNQYTKRYLTIFDIEKYLALSIITYNEILEYLISSFREKRRLFDQNIYDLKIGTYNDIINNKENVITVMEDTPLIKVLNIIMENKISSVPVTDHMGTVINIYCIDSVMDLLKDQALSQLDKPIIDILKNDKIDNISSYHNNNNNNNSDRLCFCTKTDTLHILFEKFAAARVRRLVCINQLNQCIGIVTLSDLFNYLLADL